MPRLLIVKTSSLGDIVQTFPVLSYLKARDISVEIDWVVERPFADLVKAHPHVSRVITIDSKNWRKRPFSCWSDFKSSIQNLRQYRYDLVFDLQGNTKSALFTKLARAPIKVGLAPPALPEWPNRLVTTHRYLPEEGLSIREEYLNIVSQYFQENAPRFSDRIQLKLTPEQAEILQQLSQQLPQNTKLRLLVCPGSAWANKQMEEKALSALLQALYHEFPLAVFYFAWGNPLEHELAKRLSLSCSDRGLVLPKLSLPVLQNFMGLVDCILAMDSLPLHLAATSGTATFSVFGASAAAKYAPKGEQHLAIQGNCPYKRTFEKRCPILRTCSTGACIRSLTADHLLESIKNHLKEVL